MRKFQPRSVRYTDLTRPMQESEELQFQYVEDNHGSEYDSEDEMDAFKAYQTRQSFQRKKSFLKREAWYKLSVEDKQVWDKLVTRDKLD